MTEQDEGTPPPVDLEAFRETMRAAGVEEVVDATVEVYLSEMPAVFRRISDAVEAGDAEAVRSAAHSLKSASGNIRAQRMFHLLQELEDLGRRGDVAGIRALWPEVRDEFSAVVRYLQG
ncbi:MAG: Hpt domain-containing protein [Gemmatimonadota bacterium]